ncbi:MAG: cation transporter [Desulfuromonadales bacterium]
MNKSLKLFVTLGIVAAALVAGIWLLIPSGSGTANAALAEYQIEKLTCGSCVSNIESALSSLDGVGSVEVNLTSNRGRVTYDPAEIDSSAIEAAITKAGYPARVRLQLDPQEYNALQEEQAQLGQKYLARIGDRLLARTDFEQIVQQRAGGDVSADQQTELWQAAWKDVLQRELLLSAAEKNRVVIQEGEVDAKLDELRQGHQGLDQLVVQRYGSMDNFRTRLREDMIINRNIEDHVYAGIEDPRQQQSQLQAWYADLQKETEVIIFDPQLKAVGQAGSGCACCNS